MAESKGSRRHPEAIRQTGISGVIRVFEPGDEICTLKGVLVVANGFEAIRQPRPRRRKGELSPNYHPYKLLSIGFLGIEGQEPNIMKPRDSIVWVYEDLPSHNPCTMLQPAA